jgi:hypothetical protein
MMTIKIDRPHFIEISNKVQGGFEESIPDGFLYDATTDQAATPIMKYVIKQVAVIPSDTKEQNQKPFLDHESKHYRNKYTFPEYLSTQFTKTKLDTRLLSLKEEITAGIEEGQDATSLFIRLYGQDIYNRDNGFIKAQRIRMLAADERGDNAQVKSDMELIEKVKLERAQYANWLIQMLEESFQIIKDQPELGSDLLAVAPAKHWKLFTGKETTLNMEAINGLKDTFDHMADTHGDEADKARREEIDRWFKPR